MIQTIGSDKENVLYNIFDKTAVQQQHLCIHKTNQSVDKKKEKKTVMRLC